MIIIIIIPQQGGMHMDMHARAEYAWTDEVGSVEDQTYA